MSIQAQQFSLAQNTAQFNEQQWVNTQELGPIGATPTQTGRSAYFQYMARQTAAGYNPLSQDNASTFQFKGQPFGLQNLEFYAGIENQTEHADPFQVPTVGRCTVPAANEVS